MKPLPLALAFLVAALTGCSAPADRADTTQSNETGAAPESGPAALAGEWARCWLEPNAPKAEHRLLCAGPADGNPLQPTSVSLSSVYYPALNGQTIALEKAPPSFSADTYRRATFDLGSLPDWLFPLPLRFEVQLPPVGQGAAQVSFDPADDEGTDGPVIDLDVSIDATSTAQAPLVVKQPFELWALDIEAHNTDNKCAITTTSIYDVSIAPFKHHRTGKQTLGIASSMFEFDSTFTAQRAYYVAAPPSGAIDANYWGAGSASMKRVELTGSGTYVATDDGLTGPTSP